MKVNLIYSRTKGSIIGVNGDLLCRVSEDMKWFKRITMGKGNIVIMGYKTWLSIPRKPLPDRYNIILTKHHKEDIEESEYVKAFTSFEDAMTFVGSIVYHKVFVIGGAQIFEYVLMKYQESIDCIYETLMDVEYDGGGDIQYISRDLIGFENVYKKEKVCKGDIYGEEDSKEITCQYLIYQNKEMINRQEYQYLELLKHIRENGVLKKTRNADVLSSFGEKMVFDLREGFPLLTTKKMGWKTILRELLWFLSGSTDNKELQKKNVHIWDMNASKEYMATRGLDYEEGDLGPIYGFQWRHFGDEYRGVDHNHTGGVDQIKEIIHLLKNDPMSRRIILSAWNPSDLGKMALPPCHILTQFSVDGEYLDAQLYQRSGDMFLGVPYNIASYSFLLHILGKMTGYIPRYLHHVIGDCHIYSEHIDAVETQLERVPHTMAGVEIDTIDDIDTVTEDMIRIFSYKSYSQIKAPMIA